jgi:hypothetical protein
MRSKPYLKPTNYTGRFPCGYTSKRYTWKWFGSKTSSVWGRSGKYIKGQYNRRERRVAKRLLRGLHSRKALASYRSEVDYKGH